MRALVFGVLVACSSAQTPPPNDPDPSIHVPADTRKPIDKRRDVACDQLAPKLTECAIADAKASMTPDAYAKLDPEQLRAKHKAKFLSECKGSEMSSRQVRVLEVCFKQETECDPLADCLANLKPAAK